MVKIRKIVNGWLVSHSTFRIEGHAAYEDGVAERAFTYDAVSEISPCWSAVLEFVAERIGPR